MVNIVGIISLSVNMGLNFILSILLGMFVGIEEPFSCNIIKWIIIINIITIGIMKCNEKNRFNVGWDTEGPPHTHTTRSCPTNGIADITPVITVAPQNDICPHGKTYPKKAVIIVSSMIIIPVNHTFFLI